jgi:hypothetical protein
MTSLVILAPDALREAANKLAEATGWGPDNLARRLVDAKGWVWWGCRAEASPADLARFAAPSDEAAPVVKALVLDTSDTLSGFDHWQTVLQAHGLRMADDEAP